MSDPNPYFREAFEGLRDAAQHLMAASEEIKEAGAALVRTADLMIHAREEHDDLRESVRRLEGLVEELLRRQNGNKQ